MQRGYCVPRKFNLNNVIDHISSSNTCQTTMTKHASYFCQSRKGCDSIINDRQNSKDGQWNANISDNVRPGNHVQTITQILCQLGIVRSLGSKKEGLESILYATTTKAEQQAKQNRSKEFSSKARTGEMQVQNSDLSTGHFSRKCAERGKVLPRLALKSGGD